ncbi:MAG: hypothetical protein A7315_00535 [Candidatus Altiarchaeales archaeon WOR_SM1_79]|nr:MAG: hypothetical protein A7315_00535 [Candidatus Altiarchaeales archaeon WOR_SM1_79]
MIEKNDDHVKTAIKLSIAGNIMDFGALDDFDIQKTIDYVMDKEIDKENYNLFLEKLKNAKSVLFFADNSGEIVFDKLLLETLNSGKNFNKISLVVKGGPVLNDATIDDAKYAGIDKIPNLKFLTTSNGDEGTGPERNSPEVKSWILKHDLVISKGQGNYEGLSQFNGLFFMLMAKCHIVAEDLGVDVGSVVLKYK